MARRYFVGIAFSLLCGMAMAQEKPEKKGLVPALVKYFADANKPNDKPFDCSVIAGPFYNPTISFAVGGGISAQYSWDQTDSLLQKSTLSAMGKVGIKGMVELEVKGNNYMKQDRSRWHYMLKLSYIPMKYWGEGYDNGIVNYSKKAQPEYKQVKLQFKPDYVFRVANNLYVGPMANLKYMHAYDFKHCSEQANVTSVGVGASLQYDSRDFPLNAYRGQYLRVEQLVYPKFMNKGYFNSTDITFSTYHELWKKAVLAFEYHSLFNYGGEVPWTMMAQVAEDSNRMRGYYEGRYRDRNLMEVQLELRQRLVKRFGLVVFGGAANVFHDFKSIDMKHKTLPNYGVGLRWEFKDRVNVRLDCGMTKNKPGVVFNLNEAF